jgi:hypothetical protein
MNKSETVRRYVEYVYPRLDGPAVAEDSTHKPSALRPIVR